MFNGFLVLFLFPLFQTRISCATKSHKSSSNFVHHTRYEILFQLHLIILISGYVPNKGQKLSPRTVFFKSLPKLPNPFARQTFLSLLFEFSVSYRKIPDFTSIGFILCVSAHFLCSFAGGTIVVVVILK